MKTSEFNLQNGNWFKRLRGNSQKLTSPLDLHEALQQILSLSKNFSENFNHKSEPNKTRITINDTSSRSNKTNNLSGNGTGNGSLNLVTQTVPISLFDEIPGNRTCEVTGIPALFCRCGLKPPSTKFSSDVNKSLKFGLAIVSALNKLLATQIKAGKCAGLQFDKILYSRKLSLSQSKIWTDFKARWETEFNFENHVVGIQVQAPFSAQFETIVRHSLLDGSVRVANGIFRIDNNTSQVGNFKCMKDKKLKDFCYCLQKKDRNKKPARKSE